MSNKLKSYKNTNEIKEMTYSELNYFSDEIRDFLIEKVSKTGGHLASNLGVVELTLSLYRVFNFEKDKIIWDVGHQTYVYKILSGRKEGFDTLRKYKGLSGFPKKDESKFDHFNTGHSSTSISAAIGIARSRDLKKEDYNVVAVIGDGALTGGMAYEALNDIGYKKTKMIIILNDNQMSISRNVGGMSTYLSKMRLDPRYNKIKENFNTAFNKTTVGKGFAKSIKKIKGGIKQILVPGMLFEDMGLKYLGPIDGHNIEDLVTVFSMAKNIKGPVIIHVITKKGKGYNYAEKQPNKFHGIGPFNCENGEICATSKVTFSSAFGQELVAAAKEDNSIVAITAAMRDGTGLEDFSVKYPNRFFDVGIAEQHAVTLAAGMAANGLRPVFAVYSTFLQRAYDQIIHDVCLQKLPIVLAIDRAGIVGEDGETHQGIFDLSYLSHIPNLIIMSPKCTDELKIILRWALKQNRPVAIRYPRGGDNENVFMSPANNISMGKWEVIFDGEDIVIIAVGKMVQNAILAREKLLSLSVNVGIINAIFIKPIDKELINRLIIKNKTIITIEDNVIQGGFGSSVLQYVNSCCSNCKVVNLGYNDEYVPQGSTNILYKIYGLDPDGIVEKVIKLI